MNFILSEGRGDTMGVPAVFVYTLLFWVGGDFMGTVVIIVCVYLYIDIFLRLGYLCRFVFA